MFLNDSIWTVLDPSKYMLSSLSGSVDDLSKTHPNPSEIPVAAKIEYSLHSAAYLYVHYGRLQGARTSETHSKSSILYDDCGRILSIKFECVQFFQEWVSLKSDTYKNTNLEMVKSAGLELIGRAEYSRFNLPKTSNLSITVR